MRVSEVFCTVTVLKEVRQLLDKFQLKARRAPKARSWILLPMVILPPTLELQADAPGFSVIRAILPS